MRPEILALALCTALGLGLRAPTGTATVVARGERFERQDVATCAAGAMRLGVARSNLPIAGSEGPVLAIVLGSSHQLEVRKGVVGLVSVAVMHDLARVEASAEVLLHHGAMLKVVPPALWIPQPDVADCEQDAQIAPLSWLVEVPT